MRLIKPNDKYLNSYYEACCELSGNVHDNYIIHDPAHYTEWRANIFSEYEKQEKGENLPNGFVKNLTLWIVDENEYIGTINIRLNITEILIKYGGTIGFVIRPKKRRQGYAVSALIKAIDIAKKKNISPIIMTCIEDNLPSKRTIEKLNYVKKEKYNAVVNGVNRKVLRYWF